MMQEWQGASSAEIAFSVHNSDGTLQLSSRGGRLKTWLLKFTLLSTIPSPFIDVQFWKIYISKPLGKIFWGTFVWRGGESKTKFASFFPLEDNLGTLEGSWYWRPLHCRSVVENVGGWAGLDVEASDRDQAKQLWADEAAWARVRARRLWGPREENPKCQRPPLQVCQAPSSAKSNQNSCQS